MEFLDLKKLIETEIAKIDAFLVDLDINNEKQIKLFVDLIEGHISVDQLKLIKPLHRKCTQRCLG